MGEFAIGQGVSRFEDPRLVRGGGRYIDDVSLSRHGLRRRAALAARARQNQLDRHQRRQGSAWRAGRDHRRRLEGRRLAATLPSHGGLKRRDGSPMFKPRYPVLAEDRVRWVGDCVAFVVAETHAQALDAAELIAVDYEPLPAVISTARGDQADAPRVWDDCPDNICFVELIGDKAAIDAAFAAPPTW